MDQIEVLAVRGRTCSNEGCDRPPRAKTKPGLCGACASKESYHKRNPNAPRREMGFHGKWKNQQCSEDVCSNPAKAKGLCDHHYNKKRRESGLHKRSKEKNREARIKHRYGITIDDYQKLLELQEGKCAVCKQLPGDNVRAHWGGKLCIDHCHDTGKVRGLLCNDCNLAVGYGKTPDILERAAAYLRLHN